MEFVTGIVEGMVGTDGFLSFSFFFFWLRYLSSCFLVVFVFVFVRRALGTPCRCLQLLGLEQAHGWHDGGDWRAENCGPNRGTWCVFCVCCVVCCVLCWKAS